MIAPFADLRAADRNKIKRAQAAGDPEDGSTYYQHVLGALEQLVQEKNIASAELLAARKAAWVEAYEHTPHGKPVELGA